MEKEKNNNVIAYRVSLGYAALIVCFVMLIALAILVTVALAFASWWAMVIAIVVDLGFGVWFYFELKHVYLHNHYPAEYITYNRGTFTINITNTDVVKIKKKDIYDFAFKNQREFFITKHFYYESAMDSGTLYIYYKEDQYVYELKLKNVAKIEEVFDKFCKLIPDEQ